VTVSFDGGVIYLALITLIEPVLYSLGYLYIKSKNYHDVKMLRFDKNISLSILKDSYPLILASAFVAVYMRVDQVIIKNILGAKSVGLYDSAVRLSEVSYFLPQIIITSFLPAIINTRNVSTETYNKRMKKLFFGLLFLSILIAVITTLLSKHLILLIFGYGFIESLPVLCIYVWSNIGATLTTFGQQILISENKVKNISIMTLFGTVTNVILNIALIPRYGMVGAAFASLISYTAPFLSIFLFKNTRKIMIDIFKA
jgi:O-antigen/teichoic acid export membrane protein